MKDLLCVLSQRSVNFHSWNVKTLWKSSICIYSEEIKKNTWELSRDGNHVTYHRQENCFFTDLAEKNPGGGSNITTFTNTSANMITSVPSPLLTLTDYPSARPC